MRWTWECDNCGRTSIPLGQGRCVCGRTREEIAEKIMRIRQSDSEAFYQIYLYP